MKKTALAAGAALALGGLAYVNYRREGQGWKPTVTTDSRALAFLNGAACRAVLQGDKDQLTVRFFAKPEHTREEN